MKQLTFTNLLLFLCAFIFGQSQRTVLIEEFTQASCPPCEAITPALNARMDANASKLVQIRYPVHWPGRDPMNDDNPGEIRDRSDFYEVSGVPQLYMDGNQGNSVPSQFSIDAAHDISAPILVELSHEIATDHKTMNVSVRLRNESASAFSNPNARLRIAIVEEDIIWDSPPGSTSLTEFEYVFKGFVGGSEGTPIGSISAGGFLDFNWTDFDVPRIMYNSNTISVVAFVQDDTDLSVLNAADSKPQVQMGPFIDFAFVEFDDINLSGDLCNPTYNVRPTFQNVSNRTAVNPNVVIYINGEESQSVSIAKDLAPGETHTQTVTLTNLPAGVSSVRYAMENQELDTNSNNSNSPEQTYARLSEQLTDELQEDFENVDNFFGRFAIERRDMIFPVAGPIGGNEIGAYGQSSSSLVVNFFNWNPAEISASGFFTPVEKVMIPSGGGTLSFDHAHAQYEDSEDLFVVFVSTDCGQNDIEVWRQSGSVLATAATTTDLFIPTSSQWRSNEIDLSAYAGQNIHITFAFASAFGNTLLIDNIAVELNEEDNDNDGSPASVDCNDNDPTIYPGAPELCNDRDDNCNGQIDEGLAFGTYYQDRDGDGHGDINNSIQACRLLAGYSISSADCDDTNAAINPDAAELCDDLDNNCNGMIDDGLAFVTYYEDSDGDGYGSMVSISACTRPSGYSVTPGDCNDTDAEVNPSTEETCDGRDNNCNGMSDEGLATATYYQDSDGDGYGSAASLTACTQPSGYVLSSGDCDDANANINPGSPELCDDRDNNCNNLIDEGLMDMTFYEDLDGDGYGSSVSIVNCSQPLGFVTASGDCDDGSAGINPGAVEQCDNMDNNCNGLVDDGVTEQTYYQDNDNDGYGSDNTVQSCFQPFGYVIDAGDCDDTDADINPGAVEQCDNIDNNCNGQVDDGVELQTFYEDLDGDGYGSMVFITDCEERPGYVSNSEDCDDEDESINPGAEELCDELDNNCDGGVDEGLAQITYFADLDGDGYGDAAVVETSCLNTFAGFVLNPDDCDDSNAGINPAAEEIADNGIDDNCDGVDLTTALHKLADTDVNIFPNPSKDVIYIEVEGEMNYLATLYDLQGKQIISLTKTNKMLISALPSGVYLLEIFDLESGKHLVERILKQE